MPLLPEIEFASRLRTDRGTGPDEVELAEGLSELWDPALPAEEPERPRSHARPDPT